MLPEIRKIKSQHAGGMLLPPVQTLVATFIFGEAENANELRRVTKSTETFDVQLRLFIFGEAENANELRRVTKSTETSDVRLCLFIFGEAENANESPVGH